MSDTAQLQRTNLGDWEPLPVAGVQYSVDYLASERAVLLREDEACVHVGIGDRRRTPPAVEPFGVVHEKPIRFYLLDDDEITRYIARLASEDGSAGVETSGAPTQLELDRLAHDAPIVNLVNALVLQAIRDRASDIHIEAHRQGARVRYRVDGMLRAVRELSGRQADGVGSRVKVMSHLNIMERRLPQDGRMSVQLRGAPIDVRVSVVPTAMGESIVLRLFNREEVVRSLSELGLGPAVLEAMQTTVRQPHGLVLVTGPTGSGKSTTLAAMLRALATDDRKIITVEDPVEQYLDGVQQIQVNDAIGLDFAEVMRRVLRQDPNVIMVGEIRDPATAELAIRAALTGHLVFATLHTNDAPSAVERLADMGVPRFLLAATLRALFSQRLVRRIVPECTTLRAATEAETLLAKRSRIRLDRVVDVAGCRAADIDPYHGRQAIAEFVLVEAAMDRIIASGGTGEFRAAIVDAGYRPLVAAGFEAVAEHRTSPEEVMRVAFQG